jgi:RNA polymerase sigma-70 factor, ECF subfamily
MRRAVPRSRSPRLLSLVKGREASDADVAQALIDGDAWASAEAWYRMAPMVLALAERVLGSRSEAEDLTQDVFSRVFRKAMTLRDPDSLRSFVYSFAIRGLRTELRKRKLRTWLPLDRVADPGDQSRDVESRDLLRRFHTLLDRLSPRDRLVFVLRRMESMTVEEIATHLSVSHSTVKRSLNYASERLTGWIGSDPGLLDLLGTDKRPR